MSTAQTHEVQSTCCMPMHHERPCGRPIYAAPPGIDSNPVCLMHSHDPNKSVAEFQREVERILSGTSAYHLHKDRFDFSFFVLPVSNFRGVTFSQDARFHGATFARYADFHEATFNGDACFALVTFTEIADFKGAKFRQEADFYRAKFTLWANFTEASLTGSAEFYRARFIENADFIGTTFIQKAGFYLAFFAQNCHFRGARFTQIADFGESMFTQDADFCHATLTQGANFSQATFSGIADFSDATVENPLQLRFFQVNRGSQRGLHARFSNCNVEDADFRDIHWHLERGRLMLQDELDFWSYWPKNFEVVAITYRQLTTNFEKRRDYHLAEDCAVGAYEMQRQNPDRFPLAVRGAVRDFYAKHGWARWLGRNLSAANLYRLLSNYGSSYSRALAVLIVFLLAFALSFPASGLRPAKDSDLRPQCSSAVPGSPEAAVISWGCAAAHPHRFRELWGTFKAGVWASVETATFARSRVVEPATGWGRALAVVEVIVVPGQLALFLLALRRRFRR